MKRGHLPLGVALFAAHVLVAKLLVAGDAAVPFEVIFDETSPRGSQVSADDPSRVRFEIDGQPDPGGPLRPGLRYLQWLETYRGGFRRQAGAAHRVGPVQAIEAPPCSIRLRIGQKVLDGGKGSVVELVRALLAKEMRGFSSWPVGDFKKLGPVTLEWAQGEENGTAREVLGATIEAPPRGYIALHAELVFSRATLPIFVALVPELESGNVRLRAMASAKVVANNRVYRYVLGVLDGDRRATDLAQRELGAALIELLEPPPPLELPGGHTIRVTYCDGEPLRIKERAYGELPLAVVLENRRGDILPLLLPIAPMSAPETLSNAVELDIDLNGLGALLHQLWASGFLDNALDAADLAGAFNRDPQVVALLSVRASRLALRGPPVIEAGRSGFVVASELGLVITDGAATTPARLFARGQVTIGKTPETAIASTAIEQVGLTCLPEPGRLRSCYPLLVDELSRRAPDISELITTWLRKSFSDLLGSRTIRIDGVPTDVRIVATSTRAQGDRLIIDFDSSLVGPTTNE